MSDENAMKSKKGLAVKIIVPIVLVCVVAGIWAIKNKKDPDSASTDKPGSVVTSNSDSVSTDNPDFALNVTKEIDLEKLKSYGIPIIIDFGADSCIPCKAMAPVLKELNAELKGKAIVRFVDVWKYQALAQGYPISVIPTQILIDSSGKPYNTEDPASKQIKQYKSKDTEDLIFTAHEGGIKKEQLLSILKEMGLK